MNTGRGQVHSFGGIVLAMLMMLIVATIILASTSRLIARQKHATTDQIERLQSFNVADAGIQYAQWLLAGNGGNRTPISLQTNPPSSATNHQLRNDQNQLIGQFSLSFSGASTTAVNVRATGQDPVRPGYCQIIDATLRQRVEGGYEVGQWKQVVGNSCASSTALPPPATPTPIPTAAPTPSPGPPVRFYFTVDDSYTNANLRDVQVRDVGGAFDVLTNSQGVADFQVPPGRYTVSFSKAGYKDFTKEITTQGSFTADMIHLVPARIRFRVTTCSTGQPRASVSIRETGMNFATLSTDSTGWGYVLDAAPGIYTVVINEQITRSVAVTNNSSTLVTACL